MVDYSKLKDEQLKVINHGKGNILVSASAGSGKTFVMINRLIRLIKEGITDVDRILAVTFTEAAAKSMKDKLKAALTEEYGVYHDRRLEEQISLIDTADISTYHSFCKRLIQNYFYVAGVSPDFKIASEEDAAALKRTAINRVFDKFYQEDASFSDLVDKYAKSRKDSGLKDVIFYMYDKCVTEADFESLLDKTMASYEENAESIYTKNEENALNDFHISLFAVKNKLSAFIEDNQNGISEKMIKNAKDVLEYTQKLLTVSDREELLNNETKIPTAVFKNLTETEKIKNEELKALRDGVRKAEKTYTESEKDKDVYALSVKNMKKQTERLFNVLRAFKKEYDDLKREENVLDFDDLMSFGLEILNDDGVKDAVKEKYQYIFIDEYQDTNGVQEAIISRIANDNLFMVGDLKQSIYGFRNCRPEYFIYKYYGMRNTGETVENLNYNFRSANKILDLANEVFLNCMTEKTCGIDYSEHKLKSGGLYPSEYSGRTKVYHIPAKDKTVKKEDKKEKPRIYDVVEEKGKDVVTEEALLIAKIISEELGKKYYDIESRTEKVITQSDVAILMRSIANEKSVAIINALYEMGFNIDSDSEYDVLRYEEICVMKSALEITDRFYNDVPLITVMKSPIGKFSLEELAEISEFSENSDKGRLDFSKAFAFAMEKMEGALGDKIRKFYAYFENLKFISGFYSADTIMEKIVSDNDLDAHFYASGAGKAKNARLRRFISASKNNGGFSVREFLKFLKENPEAVKLNVSSGENAIKIITIHKSKGLEYPVVIVPELEHQFNMEDAKNPVLYDEKYGFAEKIFDEDKRTTEETVLREVIKRRIRRAASEEEMRVYYVALTRAKYSLYLIVNGDIKESNGYEFSSFAECLPKDLPMEEVNLTDLDFIGKRESTRKILIGEENKTFTDVMRRDMQYLYPFIKDVTLPIKTSVTSALKHSETEEGEPVYRLSFDGKDKTDTERGITAHKIMELADFYSGVPIEEQTEKFIKDGVLKREDVDKIKLDRLENVITLPAIKDSQGKSLYKEQDFIVNVPASLVFGDGDDTEILVQGIIDLLIVDEKEKTAKIVDYKYSSKQKDELIKTYKKQLDLYAYAVSKVLDLKVTEKILISLLSGESVKID